MGEEHAGIGGGDGFVKEQAARAEERDGRDGELDEEKEAIEGGNEEAAGKAKSDGGSGGSRGGVEETVEGANGAGDKECGEEAGCNPCSKARGAIGWVLQNNAVRPEDGDKAERSRRETGEGGEDGGENARTGSGDRRSRWI
jgi:hypothetical protein